MALCEGAESPPLTGVWFIGERHGLSALYGVDVGKSPVSSLELVVQLSSQVVRRAEGGGPWALPHGLLYLLSEMSVTAVCLKAPGTARLVRPLVIEAETPVIFDCWPFSCMSPTLV